MGISSKIAEEVPVGKVKKERKKIIIYESETTESRTFRTKDLTIHGTLLQVPVQKWENRVNVIIPGNKGEGPVQIASVGVPFSMAFKKSVFNTNEYIYVTSRATDKV